MSRSIVVIVAVVAAACGPASPARSGHPVASSSGVDRPDARGYTRLQLAALEGELEEVRRLLAAGADPNSRAPDRATPLHYAAEFGHAAIVDALLAAGANVRLWNGDGKTPLHAATWDDSAAIVRTLLRAGADIDARQPGGPTPLMWATEYGHEESALALIAAGADVHAGTGFGSTALHSAAADNSAQVVEALLAAGADPDAGPPGTTPLHAAAGEGAVDAARILIQHGARVDDHAPGGGETPLFGAARSGGAITELLLAAGADPDAVDSDGQTALHWAAMLSQDERGELDAFPTRDTGRLAVPVLIKHKATIDVRDHDGNTPLLACITHGGDEVVVAALLAAGADPGATNRAGLAPLAAAVERHEDEVVTLLRARGAK